MRAKNIKTHRDTLPDFSIERDWVPDEAGSIAVEMAVRWGMVAAVPDGEDSAGRAKLRLLTPDELAQRAIDTAQALHSKMRADGMVLDLPALNESTDGDE